LEFNSAFHLNSFNLNSILKGIMDDSDENKIFLPLQNPTHGVLITEEGNVFWQWAGLRCTKAMV
jgi:hypothetical protein